MNQPPLFNDEGNAVQLTPVTATELRDAAIEQVDSAASVEWKDRADHAAKITAESFSEFTSDQVFELMDAAGIDRPREPRAMGPVMQRLVGRGLAIATDRMRNSTHKSCHARPKRVYRSLVMNGATK